MTSFAALRQKWVGLRDAFLQFKTSVDGAELAGQVLTDLDALEKAQDAEALSLREAAAISGYHPESLSRLVRRGKLTNVGSPRRPRLLRAELPKKPMRPGSAPMRLVTAGNEDATAALAREAAASRMGRAKSA